MSDINYQLEALRISLAREEEILAVISCAHNHAEIRERVMTLRADIKRLEEWDAKQNPIRSQDVTYSSGPCGGA